MGLSNSDTISGHVGIAAYWSGGHHHAPRRMNTIPLPVPQLGHWMDELFKRPPAGVGKVLHPKVNEDKVFANAVDQFNYEKQVLQANGLSGDIVDYILTQDYMESGAYSNVGAKNNNPGNIMWPKKGKLKYGTKGPYNAVNKTYYGSFPNLDSYVKEKIAVLSEKPGEPIKATSGADYVRRLKMNNYFGNESEASYLDKLKYAAKRINIIGDLWVDSHQDIAVPDSLDTGLWPWMKAHPILTGVGLAAVGLVVIKSVLK